MNFFSNNFLQAFAYSEEPFVVYSGRVYTLRKSNGPCGSFVSFLGNPFELRESEKVVERERIFFEQNKNNIEEYISSYINSNYGQRARSLQENITERRNHFESIQDTSIEKFIMVDVFDQFFGQNTTSSTNHDFTDVEIPSVQPVVEGISTGVLKSITSSDLFTISNKCYELLPHPVQNENTTIHFHGRSLYPKETYFDIQQLASWYNQALKKKVQTYAEEQSTSFLQILTQLENQRREIDNLLQNEQRIPTASRGSIAFSKSGENEYTIITTIPPYIIKAEEKFYHFEEAKIGIQIAARGNNVQIRGEPNIYNRPYTHPFVFSSFNSGLCFNGFPWKEEYDVEWNKYYPLDSMTANRISQVLHRGVILMTDSYGYKEEDFVPVRRIGYCDAEIADNISDAKRFAQGKGIPFNERCYNADR